MAERIFQELHQQQVNQQRHLCVGIDINPRVLRDPKVIPSLEDLDLSPDDSDLDLVTKFNRRLIEATAPWAAAYKTNIAFPKYIGFDWPKAVIDTVETGIREAPHAVEIVDAKYGDIDSTNG